MIKKIIMQENLTITEIPFDAEGLADMAGFGDLYRKSKQMKEMGEAKKIDIKNMMSKLEEIRKRDIQDVID